MRAVHFLASWSVWLALSLQPGLASGNPTTDEFSLNWVRDQGAEACVSSEGLRHLLEMTTGVALSDAAAANLTIEGNVSRGETAKEWAMRVRIVSDQGDVLGERQLSGHAALCSSLTPSLLLVLAMVVAPNIAGRALPEPVLAAIAEQARVEEQGILPAPIPSAVSAKEQTPSPPTGVVSLLPRGMRLVSSHPGRHGPVFSTELTIGTEFAPTSNLGLAVGFELPFYERWLLSLTAAYWEKSSVPVTGPHTLGGGVVFQSGLSTLSVCRRLLELNRYRTAACVGAALAFRATNAEALSYRNDSVRFYAGPSAALVPSVELAKGWLLVAHGGIATLLPHHRFTYAYAEGGSHVIFQPGAIAGWLAVGMAKEF